MSETIRPSLALLTSVNSFSTEAIIRATQNGTAERILDADVRLVISNQPEADVFDTVKWLNKEHGLDIRTLLIGPRDYPGGEGKADEQTLAESEAIAKHVSAEDITLVAMVGYFRKARGDLRAEYGYDSKKHGSAYQARLVNSHLGPFILTKGMFDYEAQQAVLDSDLKYSAQSVLAVDQTVKQINDKEVLTITDNVLITEHRVPVDKDDSSETLLIKVRELEAKHLPHDLNTYLQFHSGYKNKN